MRLKAFIIFGLILLSAKTSHAAISQVTQAGSDNSGGTTQTYPIAITNASSTVIVCITTVDGNFYDISSVSLGGKSGTEIIDYFPAGLRETWAYLIYDPPTGTNDIYVTMQGSVTNNILSSASVYTGTLSTIPTNTITKACNSASDCSESLTTTVNNSWIIGCSYINDGSTFTALANTTIRATSDYGNAYSTIFDSGSAIVTPDTKTLGIDYNGTTALTLALFELKPYVTQSTSTTSTSTATTTANVLNYQEQLLISMILLGFFSIPVWRFMFSPLT